MATLEEIIKGLKSQASNNNRYASKVINLKGLRRLMVQLNAAPDGHISMTIHSRSNYKKQLGIVADDANDLATIAAFLQKYADILNKYVKFSITSRNGDQDIEVDDDQQDEQQQQPKPVQQQKSRSSRNVEDEF